MTIFYDSFKLYIRFESTNLINYIHSVHFLNDPDDDLVTL